MTRTFNITGPCFDFEHYMLDAQGRVDDLRSLIDSRMYFVLHAARQSGKTTLLLDLMRDLEANGQYYAIYCSLETLQEVGDRERGIRGIIAIISLMLEYHAELASHADTFGETPPSTDVTALLGKKISRLCRSIDRPLVILFDEVDCLSNGTLIAFLRELRQGYITRHMAPFAHAVMLVGMRDIRDFKMSVRPDRETLGPASPFNVIRESRTLRNFERDEIASLYNQHTEATGQVLPDQVINEVWHWTRGQPWLVNAIAVQIVERDLGNDHSKLITEDMVRPAVESLILRRDTHIDSLMERLKEERVRRIIEPMILGEDHVFSPLDDDYCYARDLGLVTKKNGGFAPSNPIYGEVIIRTLNARSQAALEGDVYAYQSSRYEAKDGSLDVRHLLEDFQAFWREHSEIWCETYQYREAAPHLVLLAFLQRVVNGGGRLDREFATGRGRIDVCIHWREWFIRLLRVSSRGASRS